MFVDLARELVSLEWTLIT